VKEKGISSAVVIVIVIVIAAIGGGTIAIYYFKVPIYFKAPIDVIQTFALVAAVVLSAVTFWYRTLRNPKFKINPSPIGTIELYWDQGFAFRDLDIIVSNEGAKVGTISDIKVLEGNQVSENIEWAPRHEFNAPPPFALLTAIRVGTPLRIPLRLSATNKAQIGETYRIRIQVKGSDTCATKEFDARMPKRPPKGIFGT